MLAGVACQPNGSGGDGRVPLDLGSGDRPRPGGSQAPGIPLTPYHGRPWTSFRSTGPGSRAPSTTTSTRPWRAASSPATAVRAAVRSRLEDRLGAPRALITPSCTAALEMAAILCDLAPGRRGDHAVVHVRLDRERVRPRGAIPVFVDVRAGHPQHRPAIDRGARSPKRTRAIVVVHYGGVAATWTGSWRSPTRHGLMVVEDAAHSLPGTWRGRQLGSIGHLATFSFHETKNVHCGEGGALVVNDATLVARAEIVQEKGTNRAQFFRGRSINTRGRTWAPLTCSAKSPPHSCGPSWSIWMTSRPTRRHLGALPRRACRFGARRPRPAPSRPARLRSQRPSVLLALARPDLRDGFIDALARARRARGLPLRAAAQLARGPQVRARRPIRCRSPRTPARDLCGCRCGVAWAHTERTGSSMRCMSRSPRLTPRLSPRCRRWDGGSGRGAGDQQDPPTGSEAPRAIA